MALARAVEHILHQVRGGVRESVWDWIAVDGRAAAGENQHRQVAERRDLSHLIDAGLSLPRFRGNRRPVRSAIDTRAIRPLQLRFEMQIGGMGQEAGVV
jgi:hypothetical protein